MLCFFISVTICYELSFDHLGFCLEVSCHHIQDISINQFYFLCSVSQILKRPSLLCPLDESSRCSFIPISASTGLVTFSVDQLWAAERVTLPKRSFNVIHRTTGPEFPLSFGADVASSWTNLHFTGIKPLLQSVMCIWPAYQTSALKSLTLVESVRPSVRADGLLPAFITLMNKSYTVLIIFL